MENDRVFGDLWGKSNVPVVLNNPYSEAEQVRARGSCCFAWEGGLGVGGPSWWVLTPQRTCKDYIYCPEDLRSQELELMGHKAIWSRSRIPCGSGRVRSLENDALHPAGQSRMGVHPGTKTLKPPSGLATHFVAKSQIVLLQSF